MGIKATIRGGLAGLKGYLAKNFQEPERAPMSPDEANPHGMVRPQIPDTLKYKANDKDQSQYKPKQRDTTKFDRFDSTTYNEPDPADPKGIKRPEIKPNKPMSQYDGKDQ